jgi:hypothetical protein
MTDRVRRTSAGLRDAIFDEIDAIRAGESSSARANAISKLASGIVKNWRSKNTPTQSEHRPA